MRVGVAAVGRPTFDTDYAAAMARRAHAVLETLDVKLVGSGELLLDDGSVGAAAGGLAAAGLDAIVVLQATFTDATLVEPFGGDVPLVLWAFPEERRGGRLRLNSLCGINLGGFALRRAGHPYRWVYRDPADPAAPGDVHEALQAPAPPAERPAGPRAADPDRAERAIARLAGSTVGLIGDHPTGFPPCAYDAGELAALTGARVDRIELDDLFAPARAVSSDRVTALRAEVEARLGGTVDLAPEPFEASLGLHLALRDLAASRSWNGVAARCWPECFTEYGSAACAALGMLPSGIPACCEADVYGNVTALLLEALAEGPAFVADLVHLDREDDTAVMWHCGIAPPALADPGAPPRAAIHSNRRLPLLHEFPLKPGAVTVARLSRAGGRHSLVVGRAEMLRRSLPFSGTAGTLRFDRPVDAVLGTVMGHGLEHHYGIVYGDVAASARTVADRWEIPVIEL